MCLCLCLCLVVCRCINVEASTEINNNSNIVPFPNSLEENTTQNSADTLNFKDEAQMRGMTVAIAYTVVKAGVVTIKAKLPYASSLLSHSISASKPSNLTYTDNVGLSKGIKATKEYNNILNTIKTNLKKSKQTTESDKGYIEFIPSNSSYDIYLSVQHMTYSYKATRTSKTSKKWTIAIEFTDTYDFNIKE